MFVDDFKRTCNNKTVVCVIFGYTCPNVTEGVRLRSLLQPKRLSSQSCRANSGVCPLFPDIYTDKSWRTKNKKAIKKTVANLLLWFFLYGLFSFCCHSAKYLLVRLLPLLPIRILWKLHVVITVTIVTRIVGPLLQGLLGDGLGPPVLLVVGLAALGVRLVEHVSLPFPTDVTAAVALYPARTAAPLRLERDAPPSSTTPRTAEGQTSLGIAATATWRRSSTGSGGRRPPPAGTRTTAPHAVHIIITIIRVFVSSTVIVIVVTIVVVIVIFISIIVWWISVTPSTTTTSASAWRGHTWRWIIVVIVIPAKSSTVLKSEDSAPEAESTNHTPAPAHPEFLVVWRAAWRSFLFLSGGFAKTISISSPPTSFPFISSIAWRNEQKRYNMHT